MHHRPSAVSLVALIVLLATTPLLAATNNPNVRLEYKPQQTVAPARFYLRAEIFDHPVRLEVSDHRPQSDPTDIGWRTNDADERFGLHATNDVEEFVADVLVQVARDHGIGLRDDAPKTLSIKLTRFRVEETNQAVGATYVANASLTGELRSESGEKLWEGVATGDATRWGRKFSNANCNEVLSDALLEAYAHLLSQDELQAAWTK